MKKIVLILIVLLGVIVPFACTNNNPTGPLATYNLTATFTNTFTPTATNWAGYTSTATPGAGTFSATPTCTNTATKTTTSTFTATTTNTLINTATPTNTTTSTYTVLPTPVLTAAPWLTNNSLPPDGLTYGVSAGPVTTIYVAEGYENESNGQSGQIEMFNTSGTSLGTMTTYDGTHSFGQPNGVAYFGGNIYVVDQVNNAVYEINPAGPTLIHSLTTWTSTGGSAPGSFAGPEGIAVDGSGNVYVADTGNDYIEVFTSALSTTPLAEFGGSGSANSKFNNPSALTVDVSGNIYVADASNQRIQIFTSSYVYSSQFSTGSSSDIYGITLDSTPHIYVADSGTAQVEEYNSAGVFLTSGLGVSPANSPSPDGLVFIGSNLLVADYSNNQLYLVAP